jgi:hypothetical protein
MVHATHFEPENELEHALVRAIDDAQVRPLFYQLLMASNIFVVGEIGRRVPADRPTTLKREDVIKLAFVEREGRKFHPVFSALTRLRTFTPPDKQHFCLRGEDLFLATRGAQFVLNPGSEAGKELHADEIGHWLAQVARTRKDADQPMIGLPKKRPAALLKALGVLFVNRQVQSARFVEIRGDQPTARSVLAVETDSDWRKLKREIGAAAQLAAPGVDFELLRLNASDRRDAFTRQLLSMTPFYVRKQFQEQKEPTS